MPGQRFSLFASFQLSESPDLPFSSFCFPTVDMYALAMGMGTEGTFVEAPALPRGLTGVLASAVDSEGPREILWSPVPLCQTGYMTSIRNPGASWPLCCGLKHLGI